MILFNPDYGLLALLLALAVDALTGEPAWLYRRVPHPVVLIGRGLAWVERRWLVLALPPARLRLRGVLACLAIVGTAALIGLALHLACRSLPWSWLWEGLLMSSLIAQRSLQQHVVAVAAGLRQGLAEGRAAVAMIVGRDPDSLDAPAVARAAIESTAENFADGVVAPVFWTALLGLPGLLAYKAINTADSMIGHLSPRYQDFGWFAARLDDVANWLPARLAGLLLGAAAWLLPGASANAAWRAMLRDARRHRSPNAGWPEAAMAGALGLRLAGPRRYGGEPVEDAWMGDGRAAATAADIERALQLFWRACGLQALLLLGLLSLAR